MADITAMARSVPEGCEGRVHPGLFLWLVNDPLYVHMVLSLYVSLPKISLPIKALIISNQESTLFYYNLMLYPQQSNFQVSSHSEILGVRA